MSNPKKNSKSGSKEVKVLEELKEKTTTNRELNYGNAEEETEPRLKKHKLLKSSEIVDGEDKTSMIKTSSLTHTLDPQQNGQIKDIGSYDNKVFTHRIFHESLIFS